MCITAVLVPAAVGEKATTSELVPLVAKVLDERFNKLNSVEAEPVK